MEGSIEVPIEGQETKVRFWRDLDRLTRFVPPTENVHLMTNYIVEKGKPLIKFV